MLIDHSLFSFQFSFDLAYSELPAFLTQDGGLNSGFMIAHCTAAALGKYVQTCGLFGKQELVKMQVFVGGRERRPG